MPAALPNTPVAGRLTLPGRLTSVCPGLPEQKQQITGKCMTEKGFTFAGD